MNCIKDKLTLCFLLFVIILCIPSCSKQETQYVQNSLKYLEGQEKLTRDSEDECWSQYYAPAYQRGVDLLNNGGTKNIQAPVILYAVFATRIGGKGVKSLCAICWLEQGDKVKGLFIKDKNEKEIELYPEIFHTPVECTFVRMNTSEIILDKEDENSISEKDKKWAIKLDLELFKHEPLHVGLILKDGTKTKPIQAYVREGLRKYANGNYVPNVP